MSFQVWGAFVAASFALLLVPGPVVLMIVGQALARGPGTALPLACGKTLGDLTMMTLSLMGAGALMALHPPLFAAMRWAGVAYLLWLGAAMWRGAADAPARRPGVRGGGLRVAGRAWLAVMVNPLGLAFFVAFLPQFIDPDRSFWVQVAILEGTFVALAFTSTVLYAALAGRAAATVRGEGAARWLRRGGGATLALCALWIVAVPL